MPENVSERWLLLAPSLGSTLWVGGLVLFVPALALAWPGLDRERVELLAYLLLGIVFPMALLGLVLLSRRAAGPAAFARVTQFGLGAGLLIAGCVFVFLRFQTFAVIAALVQGLVMWLASGKPLSNTFSRSSAGIFPTWAQMLALGILMILLWTIAGEFLYWAPLDALVMCSFWRVLAFLGCAVLTGFALRPMENAVSTLSPGGLWVSRGCDFIGIMVFAAIAANPLPLTDESAYAHWGCFVGPAQLVRSGHWLLWDTHAQYGFLSTLAIAFFPVPSTWQALYLLNAALLFGEACILYAVLRSTGRSLPHGVFCFLVVAFAVFLDPGKVYIPSGVQVWPSVGAFRFFWCYALLAMILWITSRPPSKRSRLVFAGSVVWVLGSLWSAESFTYCSAIWLPFAVLLRIDASGGFGAAARRGIRAFLADTLAGLLLPALLLVTTLLVITGWYLLRLGHLPDPVAFFDAALAFTDGYSALPLGPSAWVALAAFWMLAVVIACCLQSAQIRLATLATAVAAWAAFWAVHSYVVGHSHRTSCANLTPILCLCLAATLLALKRASEADSEQRLLRAMAIPLFAVVLFAPLASDQGIVNFFRRSIPLFDRVGRVDSILVPKETKKMRELFEQAGVRSGDPINALGLELVGWTSFDDGSGKLVLQCEHPAFLPIQPAWILYPLASRPHRIRKYFERFAARSHASGWLLIPSGDYPKGHPKWFGKLFAISHRRGRTFTNEYGRLVWMEYVGGSAERDK